jgi:hypothetical protein
VVQSHIPKVWSIHKKLDCQTPVLLLNVLMIMLGLMLVFINYVRSDVSFPKIMLGLMLVFIKLLLKVLMILLGLMLVFLKLS